MFASLLTRELAGRVTLSAGQAQALEEHYAALVRWNRVLNLTSIRSLEEAVVRHYCESLYFASLLPAVVPGMRILDLGSGAGFPGFPIAVLLPECRVTLLESHARKAVFLKEVSRQAGNINVLAQRAEDLTGEWDLVVSRAVAPVEVLTNIPRLAPRVGMLVGGDFLTEQTNFPGIRWNDPVKLPWGEGRWAVFGATL